MENNHIVLLRIKRAKFIPCTHTWRPGTSQGVHLALSCHAINASDGGRDGEAGDEELQGILVDTYRVQSDRVRVSELVEEETHLLNGMAEGANDEYQRIAEETSTLGNRVNLRREILVGVVCTINVQSQRRSYDKNEYRP